MKVSATVVGEDAVRARQAALLRTRDVVGEVYWAGARNVKLGNIHAAGYVKAGAKTVIGKRTRRQIAARQVLIEDRFLSAPARAKLLKVVQGRAVTTGIMPARNPHFIHAADADRVQRTFREGVDALVAGKASDFTPFMAKAVGTVRDAMRRNIAPDARVASQHVGWHEPKGTAVGEGTKMAPLNRAYRARKLKKHGPRPILVATGELRESIRSRTVRGR